MYLGLGHLAVVAKQSVGTARLEQNTRSLLGRGVLEKVGRIKRLLYTFLTDKTL